MDHAQTVLETLTGSAPPSSAQVAPQAAQPPQRRPSDLSAELLEQLRRELPPPITRAGSGQKTHGRWIGPDGAVQPIVSGKDPDSESADIRLERLGMPGRAARAADVELKLAARMAREGIEHATVVINYTPCRGRFGCDTLIPILLPEGSTLTVHGVTAEGQPFRRQYTGGARPWWR